MRLPIRLQRVSRTAAMASGVCALALAAGCSNQNKPPQTAPPVTYPQYPATAAAGVYVIQQNTGSPLSSVVELAANAQGSVAPLATINSPANTSFSQVAVDTSGNVYVAAGQFVGSPNPTYEILVYTAGANGNATPTRTITVPAPVTSLAVDTTAQVYALSQTGVSVYAATATGNATPVRQIPTTYAGATSTGLTSPTALTVDSAQDIYVDNLTGVLVFSQTATGDVAPVRDLSWSPSLYGEAIAIAVDISGHVFATTACSMQVCNGATSKILEFAADSNGFLIPMTVLFVPTTSPSNEVTVASGLAVDGAGNLYTQLATGTSAGLGQVTYINTLWVDVFAAGSTTPVQISSTAWTNYSAASIAVH